jgi:glutathione S-transferase
MKLIFAPGACSLGIHVVLEEIGKPYETEAANLRLPREDRPLTAINPKSKVPTLVRDDGSVLTEYPAIAYWLARTNPAAGLFPDDVEAQARTLEALDFCVATLHMQGFTRFFAARRAATPAEAEALTAQGADIVGRGLERVAVALGDKDWLVGDYSIADSALFYVCTWAAPFNVTLPDRVAAHLARMKARPAVAAVLTAEGLA